MPYFKTSQEWLEQSSLLLQAYPTSTRITTKYNITSPSKLKPRKQKATVDDTTAGTANTSHPSIDAPKTDADGTPPNGATAPQSTALTAAPSAPRASLTLKTYDPVSGICLKYRTDKAAEVGRLVMSLGRLGRTTAAIPEKAETEDAVMTEAHGGEVGLSLPQSQQAQVERRDGGAPGEAKGGQGGAQGGPKKKKKGKN